MSTGISISSINRIKELAEEKKFKEALEILDTQNLDKSINPQFLKISGEIFRENKRYYDSRRILLKAHQMAPQGNRILYELIQLYLELGYFAKARKYYEQYMFYATPDDTLKDYVEYIMKKAEGADVKDLAAILIPILERMPEDRWNFEAILLYHKMDRKDMALEESRYILEHFKESEYVQPVIEYIDDKLDIDKWFDVYPKEEQPEDMELFADLIEQEERILELDYKRMYPPEARIMVEAEDKDAPEVSPVKDKKAKKRFGKKKQAEDIAENNVENTEEKPATESATVQQKEESTTSSSSGDKQDAVKEENTSTVKDLATSINTTDALEAGQKQEESFKATVIDNKTDVGSVATESDATTNESQGADKDASDTEQATTEQEGTSEEQVKKEREEALEKILAKKIDTEKIKESAKQVAKAVKEIDTDKAKQQVKNVAEAVKDNVTKASNAFGVSVSMKTPAATEQIDGAVSSSEEDEILDGIIESVLEPPKKAVGQVVMNEELDALIPDSLEAMSEKEIANIEAKKEEMERLELEALEAALNLEEEKKAKKLLKRKLDDTQEDNTAKDGQENISDVEGEESTVSDDNTEKQDVHEDVTDKQTDLEQDAHEMSEEQSDAVKDASNSERIASKSDGSMYAELKQRFIMEAEDEKPLESLGFITVVHSDVDTTMEDEVPDAAGMLRQMIDNKEYYSGESSLGFESKASYENHGFEVEDYDFDTYRKQQEEQVAHVEEQKQDVSKEEETPSVQVIFTEERVVAFEEVASEESVIPIEERVAESMEEKSFFYEEPVVSQETVEEESVILKEEPTVVEEEPVVSVEEPVVVEEEPTVVEEEPMVSVEEPVVLEEEPIVVEEEPLVSVEEPVVVEEEPTVVEEEPVVSVEEPVVVEEEPTVVEEKPVVSVEEPVILEEEPTVVEEEPVVSVEEPVILEEEPIVVEEEPVVSMEESEAETAEEKSFFYEEPVVYQETVEEPSLEQKVEVPQTEMEEDVDITQEYLWKEKPEINTEESLAFVDEWMENSVVPTEESLEEKLLKEEPEVSVNMFIEEDLFDEEPISVEEFVEERIDIVREGIRTDIVISYRMENLLLKLKESR